jgi:phage terminase large subunit GpA-like protein
MIDYTPYLVDILDASKTLISNILPSDWTEKHRVMEGNTPFPGQFSYKHTPYLIEPVNCFHPAHPAKIIVFMKGAQLGFSTGVLESAIGYIISEQPGHILFLTGHSDLADEAMSGKIDQMIDSCGLRPLIRPSVLRTRNMRTGDTNKSKEFPLGSIVAGSASNHKLLRQRSCRYGIIDDYDAAKQSTKESGSTTRMILQRFAAYDASQKVTFTSTPEEKQRSNIEPLYLKGDQRRYYIPCPCCKSFITYEWSVPIEGDDKEKGGITWELDHRGNVIPKSVGYICQKCSGFFTDSRKNELNLQGHWAPTAESSQIGFYSYHLSSLYAPAGMYGWDYYVGQYMEANPVGGKQIEHLQKTFVNLCLGETFQSTGEAPKANELQKNQRDYEIGIIPEKISINDGNGKIVLITLASDLNGTEFDARIDWEIVAWAENGARYSVDQGSIGTFVPRENAKRVKEDRERFTYEHFKTNSVWKSLREIMDKPYLTDTGRKMKIFITGIDCGYLKKHAYPFIDNCNLPVVGLKGDGEKYLRYSKDIRTFKPSVERPKLYLVEVGYVKDDLSEAMKLKWNKGNDEQQPTGFMNYPLAAQGKYSYTHFFEHYEAEHRVIESVDGEPIAARWIKKNSVVQNHFWDVCVYNNVLKDIYVKMFCKSLEIINPIWTDYVSIVNGTYKSNK